MYCRSGEKKKLYIMHKKINIKKFLSENAKKVGGNTKKQYL